jgi:hypothetical protein
MRPLVGSAVLLLWALAACSPTFNWREARLDGTPLAGLLPCKPDKAERSVPLGGATVAMRMVGCEAGDVQFTLAVVSASDAGQAAALLAPWRAATLANLSVDLGAPSKPFTPKGGQPDPKAQWLATNGKQADGRPVPVQAAWFVQGNQVFQALAFGSGLTADVADTFFASLALQ